MLPKPIVKLQLRLPKKRHRELVRTAERNQTSLNAEILRRLAWDDESVDHEYQWFWLIHTVQLIWERLERADSNGIQAATWTTPKSWAKAQVRPSQADSGRSDG